MNKDEILVLTTDLIIKFEKNFADEFLDEIILLFNDYLIEHPYDSEVG